ncbi:MAG: hypothetical protein ACLFQG_10335, partial [Desulfovermiculus sp.]
SGHGSDRGDRHYFELLTLQRQFGYEQGPEGPGRRLAVHEEPGWHLAIPEGPRRRLAVPGPRLGEYNVSAVLLG